MQTDPTFLVASPPGIHLGSLVLLAGPVPFGTVSVHAGGHSESAKPLMSLIVALRTSGMATSNMRSPA